MLIEFEGVEPTIGRDVFLASTAVVLGDVRLADGVSVWYGAVLRGDEGRIEIGARSNVQDNAVLHTTRQEPTLIGPAVTIGHGAILEACQIEEGAVIGSGAIVLNGARVGSGTMVGAGSVVPENSRIPSACLVAGVPARVRKELAGSSRDWVRRSARIYIDLAKRHDQSAREIISSE